MFIAILLVVHAGDRLIGLVRSHRFPSLGKWWRESSTFAHRAAKAALFFCGTIPARSRAPMQRKTPPARADGVRMPDSF
jgi:hypothetical protein